MKLSTSLKFLKAHFFLGLWSSWSIYNGDYDDQHLVANGEEKTRALSQLPGFEQGMRLEIMVLTIVIIRIIGIIMTKVQNDDNGYDVSASVIIWVPKLGESKSGKMVSEKVKWA